MFRRVASAVAKAEETSDLRAQWAEQFYEDMSNLLWLPNSPTLMNANPAGNTGCLSACFQLTPEDDEYDILMTAVRMGMILKHGGGVGLCLSKLRPQGSPIRSTHGIAHGPVLALRELYRAGPRMITQGGKREAANLACLSVRHKDIKQFITVKKDHLPTDSKDPGMDIYNISVNTPDEFMTFETNEDKNLFEMITNQARDHGCPGFLFDDTINKDNPYLNNCYDTKNPLYFHGVNPCGEQVLPPFGACNLASINIHPFVKNGDIDVAALRLCVKRVIRFLDDVVSVNTYPDEKITEYAFFSRDIGLGIMGLADALAELGIAYGSDQSIVFCEKLMANIQGAAQEASEALGEEKGIAPAFDQGKVYRIKQRRNVALLSIAPTGSLSIFADCQGGCEPVFALVELRRQGGIEYFHVPPPVRRFLSKETLKKLGTILSSAESDEQKLKEATAFVELETPNHIKTAHQVSWKEKIDVVATLQKYVDRSISHTLNLPHDTKVDDVREAVKYAHAQKLKGITVYRDGSIPFQPYTAASTKSKEEKTEDFFEVPDKCAGNIHRIKVDMGGSRIEHIYVMVGLIPGTGKPFQVFVVSRVEDLDPKIKQTVTGFTRLISTALRAGAPLAEVVKQLEKTEGQSINSIPAKLAKVLEEYLEPAAQMNGYKCRECGSPARKEDGCVKCSKCNWSGCS